MAQTSYPAVGGTNVTDAVYEQLMAPISGNGRVGFRPSSTDLAQSIMYADSTGRQFKVRPNMAYLLRGFRWESGSEIIVRPLDSNTSGNPRIDLGVLRLDRETFTVRLEVLKGAPAANPLMPTVTQQLGATGTFEMPIGAVRVASSNVAGLPSISSVDVTAMETWLAAQTQVGHSSRRDFVEPGSLYTEYDTGRVYAGLAGSWHLIGEGGSTASVTLSTGWDTSRNYITLQRRNGMTTITGLIYRAAGTADLATTTSAQICTLPEQYRPQATFYFGGSMQFNSPTRMHVNADTGLLQILEHGILKAGYFIHFGPITYPSR